VKDVLRQERRHDNVRDVHDVADPEIHGDARDDVGLLPVEPVLYSRAVGSARRGGEV
jgi:hypothetical protein